MGSRRVLLLQAPCLPANAECPKVHCSWHQLFIEIQTNGKPDLACAVSALCASMRHCSGGARRSEATPITFQFDNVPLVGFRLLYIEES